MKNPNCVAVLPAIKAVVFLLVTVWLGAGCAASTLFFDDPAVGIHDLRVARTGIEPQDSIAIVIDRSAAQSPPAAEQNLSSCVRDALRVSAYGSIGLLTSKELSRVVSVERQSAKTHEYAWDKLLSDAGVRQRIALAGVRYLIVLTVSGEKSLTENRATYWSWRQGAVVSGKVVDLRRIRMAGKVSVWARHQAAAGIVYPLPLPLPVPFLVPADFEDKACAQFGHALVNFLASDEPAPQIVMTSLTMDNLFASQPKLRERDGDVEPAHRDNGDSETTVLSIARSPTAPLAPVTLAYGRPVAPMQAETFEDLKLAATRHLAQPVTFVRKEEVDYEDAKQPWWSGPSATFQNALCRELKLSLNTLALNTHALPPLPSRWPLGVVWIAKAISLPFQLMIPVAPILAAPLNPPGAVWGLETLYSCAR